ncbi:hypothetical protein D8I30_06375 [Brevundimonas naejangsanensis]|uniref:Uncharacterized protein n=1 Tax=Brevundimonas naejangsanensis TaxID=588932 RepID=A0A494RHD9_9CAUL|nr:hypothetical protein [Brevundimonas naejangsanensis]AYG94849.1 hypothetical protein D8I30_06375 [Brevundimonas naejangsanensis]
MTAASSHLPRLLLGSLIGAVLGLLMLGVALAAWWLAAARHEPQRLVAPEGFEARLEAAAGPAAVGLPPVYVYDPGGPGSRGEGWTAQIAPELAAQGRDLRFVPAEDLLLAREIEGLARRWAEPPRRPLLIWRDAGGLMLCRCDHPRARAQARQRLARQVPEASAADAVVAEAIPAREAETGRPYPRLGPPPAEAAPVPAFAAAFDAPALSPAPRLPGDPASDGAVAATRAAAAPRRAPAPRRADPPQAQRDADSLFF